MSEKFRETVPVICQDEISEGVFSLWIASKNIAGHAKPGQFLSLYCKDKSRMLPRPISICEINGAKAAINLVYRLVGAGTEEFSKLVPGDFLDVTGPLGNGFPIADKKAFLIGGGIGIPPLLELSKQLDCKKQIILGYRDKNIFLADRFQKNGDVYVATEDGSLGVRGNVMDVIKEKALFADIIYACGPVPMLKAVKLYAEENNTECWISLEERMACGIGACLSCVCRTTIVDEHTNVNNRRVCREGPVFPAGEVDL